MKTIEVLSGDKILSFTTKSVSFDNNEFFYANITEVTHDEEAHCYTFTYNEETYPLPYEEKYAPTLKAIFSQVQNMIDKKAAMQAAATASKDQQAFPAEETLAQQPYASSEEDTAIEKSASIEEAPAASEIPSEETSDATAMGTAANDASDTVSEEKSKKEKKSLKKSFALRKKKNAEAKEVSEGVVGDGIEVDPLRQKKLKKSFIVFGIIIALILAAAVIHYFVFGTSSDPTPANPNVNESQQYNDIDELIDDLK